MFVGGGGGLVFEIMFDSEGPGMKPRPLERTHSEVWSKGWLLKLIMYLLFTLRMLK